MKETKMRCPICEEGYLDSRIDLDRVEYQGHHAELELHYSICDTCGSEQANMDQLRINKRSMVEFRKKVDGLLTGSQVRSIRKNLGLSQAEAARIFGGGPVAFSKYEADDVTQSEAMDKLLRVVSNVPSVIDFLREQAEQKADQSNAYMMKKNVSYRNVGRKVPDISSGRVVADVANPYVHPIKDSGIAYGVDACKAGWLCIAIGPTGDFFKELVVDSLEKLIEKAEDKDRIFVDIPIGLSDGKDERFCDKEARRILGKPGASSVFRTPARATLAGKNYEEAKEINIEHTGKSLSKQSFAIMPKIKEVDSLLRSNRKARAMIREVHPEICFWALAGGKPMKFSKKKQEGREEQISVLNRILPSCGDEFERILKNYLRKELEKDDILDAMAAALTALAGFNETRTIPESRRRDSCNLPMEMVYYQHMGN